MLFKRYKTVGTPPLAVLKRHETRNMKYASTQGKPSLERRVRPRAKVGQAKAVALSPVCSSTVWPGQGRYIPQRTVWPALQYAAEIYWVEHRR